MSESHHTRIMIVDDKPENVRLLERMLSAEGYKNVIGYTDPVVAVSSYERGRFDLILLDIRMPKMDGFEVLQALHALESDDLPPVLVLTAQDDRETRLRALEAGAMDFVGKPFDRAELSNRIRNMLRLRFLHRQVLEQNRILEEKVQERTRELQETRLEVIRRLGRAAEYRDNETGLHIIRISKVSTYLARTIGCDEDWCDLINNASPMHDIGKIGIPDKILLKSGPLTPEEWKIMQSHVHIGSELLSGHSSPLLEMARIIALTHHERWDGKGYPNGFSGDKIPLEGRIVSIADVFDALLSARPYKRPWPVRDALNYLKDNQGKAFDPELASLFLEHQDPILSIYSTYADNMSMVA